MRHLWNDFLRKAYARTQQRDREEFTCWLKSGGQPMPDTEATWSRLHDLYEFFKWMQDHDAIIEEVLPSEIVAADGPEKRHWEPEGGLNIKDWPYLKACLGSEDEDFTQICRNEIVEAILTNWLQQLGYSFGVASSAVDRFDRERDKTASGLPLWAVIETTPLEEVIASLDAEAFAIAKELRDYRQKLKVEPRCPSDGPDDRIRSFWWRGEPYHLSPLAFSLVSVLWAAPQHSLPLWEVAKKVWGDSPAAISESHVHKVCERASKASLSLIDTGISISVKDDSMGSKRVWMVFP